MRGVLPSVQFPSDAMTWATASTRGATTWSHIDDHGMGTVIQVMAGYKYWVIHRPKYNDQGFPLVDMGSIDAFNDRSWKEGDISDACWEYEGVLLGPGDTLWVNCQFWTYLINFNWKQVHATEYSAFRDYR
jgi:hypothetical protein